MIEFFVSGLPRTTARIKAFASRSREGRPRRTVIVRENAGFINACQVTALRWRPPRPLTGLLEVELVYLFRHPTDVDGVPAAPVTGQYGKVRVADLDNFGKGLLDTWQGILYENDGQVVDLVQRKRWVERDAEVGTLVRVMELTVVPPWERLADERRE